MKHDKKPPHKLYKIVRDGLMLLTLSFLPSPAERKISQSYWHPEPPQKKPQPSAD